MQDGKLGNQNHRSPGHEVLFAANIAYAFLYGLSIYGFTYRIEGEYPVPASGLKYLLSRSAVRIDSFLHLSLDSRVGDELTFSVSFLSIAVLLFLLLRVSSASSQHVVLSPLSGAMTSLLAVPLCWLCAAKATWSWLVTWTSWPVLPRSSGSFWQNPPTILAVAEVVAVGIFCWFARKRAFSLWTIWLVLMGHCACWIAPIWIRANALRYLRVPAPPAFPFVSSSILLAVFPLSSVVSLQCLRQSLSQGSQPRQLVSSANRTFSLAWSIVPLALLASLWLPSPGHSVAQPKDIQSVVIKLTRSECFGVCPAYTITIHGSGLVNYTGIRNVGTLGERTWSIQSSTLSMLLEHFDRVHFYSIEGRAFEKCGDTPRVLISVSVDGAEKSVSSDAFCVGAKSGPQAAFVKLAQEIEVAVGSDRWVRCAPRCPR